MRRSFRAAVVAARLVSISAGVVVKGLESWDRKQLDFGGWDRGKVATLNCWLSPFSPKPECPLSFRTWLSHKGSLNDMEATEGIETLPPPKSPVKPRKRFVGTTTSSRASSSKTSAPRRVANQIPDDILHDPELNEAIRGE